jgi:hypothetical protein
VFWTIVWTACLLAGKAPMSKQTSCSVLADLLIPYLLTSSLGRYLITKVSKYLTHQLEGPNIRQKGITFWIDICAHQISYTEMVSFPPPPPPPVVIFAPSFSPSCLHAYLHSPSSKHVFFSPSFKTKTRTVAKEPIKYSPTSQQSAAVVRRRTKKIACLDTDM